MGEISGRVVFPGNPWPDGHAVTEFVWSARYVPESGIWMDFHLQTEDYYAGDDVRGAGDQGVEDDDGLTAWTSRGLWYNHHSCTLSSTFWAEESEGEPTGVLCGTKQKPLDLSEGVRLSCDEDLSEPDHWPRPFAIYLLGHDAVAGHSITLSRVPSQAKFDLKWTAKLALIYTGANAFEHELNASVKGVKFKGIRLPKGKNQAKLTEDALQCLKQPDRFKKTTRKKRTWLVPID